MFVVFAMALAFQIPTTDQSSSAEITRSPELQSRIDANPELLSWATWIETGSPEWPRAAWEASIEGEATLSCIVDTAGRTRACQIAAESPDSAGFGEAAMAAQSSFRFEPATFDGEPIESRVRFRVPFRFGETIEASAEMQSVINSISADGYATGACRRHLDRATVQRWDAMQAQIADRPTADYRPHDHIFTAGYAMGKEHWLSRAEPTPSQCAEMRDWADQFIEDAKPNLQKLDAQMLPSERHQFRPSPE